MKRHLTLLLFVLSASTSLFSGPRSENEPKLTIQKALELVQEKMEKEKLIQSYFVDSISFIEFDKSGPHWRARYTTEYTKPEPHTTLPIHKYVVVYMDGRTKLTEEKGIPRKRAQLPMN